MKKILLLVFMSLLSNSQCLLNNYNLTQNSNFLKIKKAFSAEDRGFKISSEFELVDESFSNQYEELRGSNYYAGKYSMFAASFKYLDLSNDKMYYLCVATTSIEPSKKTYWDQRGWFNKSMKLSNSISHEQVIRVANTPETYESETQETWSLGAGISVNEDSGITLSASYSYSETTIYPSIYAVVDTEGKYKNNCTITYEFKKYKANDKSDCSYHLVEKKYMFLYTLNNYSQHKNEIIRASFEYTPCIYRNGVINSSYVSPSNPLTYQFRLN